MESGVLSTLFPAENFSLIAVILGMPLLGAFVNGIWGKRLGNNAVRLMALSAVGVSFLASVVSFASLYALVHASGVTKGEHGESMHEHVKLAWTAWEWMHTTGGKSVVTIPINVKFSIDALSSVMMLVITGVGFLIHLYSTAYMEKDKGFARFFAYLNLFIFSMLVLVLADNLPLLFVGWEGVGLCSYLLIGFWYEKNENASAGKKAFIANRVGDLGLLCAMFLLAYYTGALDWTGIAAGADSLATTTPSTGVHIWPIGGNQYTNFLSFLQPKVPITVTGATGVAIMLLLGCTGKSAQIPLYVWLPDAMAGPTPVSALIHAATMVTAGVYLICRLSFVFVLSPFVMMLVACIGAATALFAATIALVQTDIKKVLAYSTVSQLGFMFLGVGVGAFTAGFFHVFTHAFFKACLFLGSGSVIHAMHGRVHDDVKAQDIRNMGGLHKYMPITFWTFAASTAAIIGFPFTSGFFSKDEILYKVMVNRTLHPMRVAYEKSHFDYFSPPPWLGTVLYAVAILAATMTAFYMCRVFFITFFGTFRGWTVGRPSALAQVEAAHGDHGHDDHHDEDLSIPGYAPHESPWQMTVPLILLATMAIGAGILNAGLFHFEPLNNWLDPVFESASHAGVVDGDPEHHKMWSLAAPGMLAFAIGTAIAYWMYILQKGGPAKKLAEAAPGLHALVYDKCASTSSTTTRSSRPSSRSQKRRRPSTSGSSTPSSPAYRSP